MKGQVPDIGKVTAVMEEIMGIMEATDITAMEEVMEAMEITDLQEWHLSRHLLLRLHSLNQQRHLRQWLRRQQQPRR